MIIVKNENRVCDFCGSKDLESLYEYSHNAITKNNSYLFNINNVICYKCGFVFVSPVYENNTLLNYYADSWSRFDGQRLDYDLNKRLEVIHRFKESSHVNFIEIGANKKGVFLDLMGNIFPSVSTVEPGSSTGHNFKDISEIPDAEFDFLTHYFVLEHIPNPKAFMDDVWRIMKSDGIMICEVPTLDRYHINFEPLALHEHTNHFSINKMIDLGEMTGFEILFSDQQSCSRPFGNVFVFKKKAQKNSNYRVTPEYQENKEEFSKGLMKLNEFNESLRSIKEFIDHNPQKQGVIWCANLNSHRLIQNLDSFKNISIVDSDVMKQNYFAQFNLEVMLPHQISNILNLEFVVICSSIHANDIIDQLEQIIGKPHGIEFIIL